MAELSDTLIPLNKSFDKPENELIIEQMYRLMVLNEQNITPFINNTFGVYDVYVPENTGIYWLRAGRLYKYDTDVGKGEEIKINIPQNWKKIVTDSFKYDKGYLD